MGRIELSGHLVEQDGKLFIGDKPLGDMIAAVFGESKDEGSNVRLFGYIWITIESQGPPV